METESANTPKRAATSPIEPEAKKQRVEAEPKTPKAEVAEEPATITNGLSEMEELERAMETASLTQHHQTRLALQRSIALVLRHDGFASATPEALESFTNHVEIYLESIIEETRRFATAARRDLPVPSDFESTLQYHNLPIHSLKPHLKQPVPRGQLAPTWDLVVPGNDEAYTTLPLLSDELSGSADREKMEYIPSAFPAFPSKHTYRFTPQEDTTKRDAAKIREEAALTAQHGEEALRRLVRASKMRKQKEVKTLVQKDTQGKERFRLWEATMRRFMNKAAAEDRRGEAVEQVEIADHSMIVNADAMFSRKEVSRFNKRAGAAGHQPV